MAFLSLLVEKGALKKSTLACKTVQLDGHFMGFCFSKVLFWLKKRRIYGMVVTGHVKGSLSIPRFGRRESHVWRRGPFGGHFV